jgi:hypothetical protein
LDNCDTDHLAWIASYRAPILPDVIVERLFMPSVKPEESISKAEPELMVINEPAQQSVYDWMSTIKAYLNNQLPSDDNTEVECIEHNYRMYHLIDGLLYRLGVNGIMMKYIFREESIELLEDIHMGVCGSHSSWCSIMGKVFRHGFYWPTTKDDVMEVIKIQRLPVFQEADDKTCQSSSAY